MITKITPCKLEVKQKFVERFAALKASLVKDK